MVPPCTGIENGFLEVSDVGRERGVDLLARANSAKARRGVG